MIISLFLWQATCFEKNFRLYAQRVNLKSFFELTSNIFRLLPSHDRYRLLALSLINLFLSVLDLIGVAALGVLTSVAVQGSRSQDPGNRTAAVLRALGLDGLEFAQQILFLATLSMIVFILKIGLSAFILRRTVQFLAYRAVNAGLTAMEKILTSTWSIRGKMSSQELAYAVNTATNYGVIGVLGGLAKLSADLVLIVVMIVSLLFVDFATAAITVLVFGLVSLVLNKRMRKRARSLGEEYFKHTISLNQVTLGTFLSAREIWVRSTADYFLGLVKTQRVHLARIDSEQIFLGMINKYVFEITLIVLSFFVCFIQLSAESPARAAATITIFLASIFRIGPAALSFQQTLVQLQTYFAKIKLSISFIGSLPSKAFFDSTPENLTSDKFEACIELKDVDFTYTEDANFNLRNINLRVEPGEFVAIVGPSGSGKSTLMDIMLGLITPLRGTSLISNLDSKVCIKKHPGKIGFVPQEASIIEGTVRENILLGLQSHSVETLVSTLKMVEIHEFIETLPKGLDEFLGEGGQGLSGGQKQRLSLARALVTDPQIVFLDEATNSLDAETEAAISESLGSLKHRKTLVVIAHRLSTIVNADKIIFMDKGKIESIGQFEELKKLSPKFAAFAALQSL